MHITFIDDDKIETYHQLSKTLGTKIKKVVNNFVFNKKFFARRNNRLKDSLVLIYLSND